MDWEVDAVGVPPEVPDPLEDVVQDWFVFRMGSDADAFGED